VKRRLLLAGLVAAMIVTALNIPIGATLLGLWTASLVAGDEPITLAAVATFVLVAGAAGLVLVTVLSRLGARYDSVAGRSAAVRRHVGWLRPMSGERVTHRGESGRIGALDVVLVVVVVATLLAFELWFALYSGSPFDQRTGRN
jgi:hypothetical protein